MLWANNTVKLGKNNARYVQMYVIGWRTCAIVYMRLYYGNQTDNECIMVMVGSLKKNSQLWVTHYIIIMIDIYI